MVGLFFVFLCVYNTLWFWALLFSSVFIILFGWDLLRVSSVFYNTLWQGSSLFSSVVYNNTLWQGSTSSSSESADGLADSSPPAIPAPVRDKVYFVALQHKDQNLLTINVTVL